MAIHLSILYEKCFGGILHGGLFLKINVSFLSPVTIVSVKLIDCLMLTSAGVCVNGANVVENLLDFFQVFRPL